MDTNIEKVSGKKGVVIREDKYGIEVLTMRNGYQWSGMPMDAELIDMLEQAIVEFKRTQASPASAPEGFTMSEPAILPDGSGFGTMSFPLPKDHWIYKEREYEDGAIEPNDLPAPVLTHSFRRQVIAAIRYAIRSATNCGKEDDFDPDALVQNAVYALCGPYGKAAPTPPVSEDRKDATLKFAVREVLKWVQGDFPTEGYLRDNDESRKAIAKLKQAMQEDKP